MQLPRLDPIRGKVFFRIAMLLNDVAAMDVADLGNGGLCDMSPYENYEGQCC